MNNTGFTDKPLTLITGANGFVGSALTQKLTRDGTSFIATSRKVNNGIKNTYPIHSIDGNTDWRTPLSGCQYVIHLAGRAHILNDEASDPLSEFRKVNVEGSINLAEQAIQAGVKRFIFLSSIKVNGEHTEPNQPFTDTSLNEPPTDPYGLSKWEAEKALIQVCRQSHMELVIIRPPLVYGPGVKANFLKLIHLVKKGIPLPYNALKHNARSLVYIENLIDLIVCCLTHPNATNNTFFVSDNEDISTSRLLSLIAEALQKPEKSIFIPLSFLRLATRLTNKLGIYNRLVGSLQVDISRTQQSLDWQPPFTVKEGINKTVQGLI